MRYGWIRSLPDHRDHIYTSTSLTKLPELIDLRTKCSPVLNQGAIGSCTAWAISGLLEYLELTGKGKFWQNYEPVSKLFIYYNERRLEFSTDTDSGATLRDGMKAIAKWGACKEILWGYINSIIAKPNIDAYADALQHRIHGYHKVNNSLYELRACLTEGSPFVFGASIYESFESKQAEVSGIIPVPTIRESHLGGHAMLCVGFDNAKKVFIVKNSWGVEWGDKGYCYMPYSYLTNSGLTDDFWAIKT